MTTTTIIPPSLIHTLQPTAATFSTHLLLPLELLSQQRLARVAQRRRAVHEAWQPPP